MLVSQGGRLVQWTICESTFWKCYKSSKLSEDTKWVHHPAAVIASRERWSSCGGAQHITQGAATKAHSPGGSWQYLQGREDIKLCSCLALLYKLGRFISYFIVTRGDLFSCYHHRSLIKRKVVKKAQTFAHCTFAHCKSLAWVFCYVLGVELLCSIVWAERDLAKERS